ncbi:MAG: YkvA family protein [Tardiphaga sp.]
MSGIKRWARALKRDIHAVALAARDPRVPWYARALAVAVAGYALSPIDLIPDFIPVLGYLDDLILIPLGLWAVLRLIPPEVLSEYRVIAEARASRPVSWTAAAIIVTIWIAVAAGALWLGADWLDDSAEQ